MDRVNLGVIGAGGLAGNQHIPNICLMADNAELYVLCDLSPEALQEAGARYGISRLETDHRKVLEDARVQGVVIATPEDSHVPLTLEALEAGKHVYVEKPLARGERECAEVLELQKKTGRRVFVGMNRRLAPSYQYAKKLLFKNGGPKNMFYRIADDYSSGWGRHFEGGERVFHEICHVFDILRFFTGSEVSTVYAAASRPDDEQFTLRFESGAVASILSSGYVERSMPKERFEAVAERGALVVEDFTEVRSFSLEGGDPVKNFPGHWHPDRDRVHVRMLEELGADALYALRKLSSEAWNRYNAMTAAGETGTGEFRRLEEYVKSHIPLVNYFVDKGWVAAIEHFADCIMDASLRQDAAGAADGVAAARITRAAVESRRTGRAVSLG